MSDNVTIYTVTGSVEPRPSGSADAAPTNGSSSLITPVSCSEHEVSQLNTFMSGYEVIDSTVDLRVRKYYSKESFVPTQGNQDPSFTKLVYAVTASVTSDSIWVGSSDTGAEVYNSNIARAVDIASVPYDYREKDGVVFGRYVATNPWKPYIIRFPVRQTGRIRDVRVWLELMHDERTRDSSGLRGLTVALKSPNVSFKASDPLLNLNEVSPLVVNEDPGLKSTDLIAVSGDLSGIPTIRKGTYLLWDGHSANLARKYLSQSALTHGQWHEFDDDIDMRTVFTDGSPNRNPSSRALLFKSASLESLPGAASDIVSTLVSSSTGLQKVEYYYSPSNCLTRVDPVDYNFNGNQIVSGNFVPWTTHPELARFVGTEISGAIIPNGAMTVDVGGYPPDMWNTGAPNGDLGDFVNFSSGSTYISGSNAIDVGATGTSWVNVSWANNRFWLVGYSGSNISILARTANAPDAVAGLSWSSPQTLMSNVGIVLTSYRLNLGWNQTRSEYFLNYYSGTAVSSDGNTWTHTDAAHGYPNYRYLHTAWDGVKYVSLALSGNSPYNFIVATSSDCLNWGYGGTIATTASLGLFMGDIAFRSDRSMYMVNWWVNGDPADTMRIYSSSDLVNWSTGAPTTPVWPNGSGSVSATPGRLISDGNRFILVGHSGTYNSTNYICTVASSTNGAVWTSGSAGTSPTFARCIVFDSGTGKYLIAGDYFGVATASMISSSNLTNWGMSISATLTKTMPYDRAFVASDGNGHYVGISDTVHATSSFSMDGFNWENMFNVAGAGSAPIENAGIDTLDQVYYDTNPWGVSHEIKRRQQYLVQIGGDTTSSQTPVRVQVIEQTLTGSRVFSVADTSIPTYAARTSGTSLFFLSPAPHSGSVAILLGGGQTGSLVVTAAFTSSADSFSILNATNFTNRWRPISAAGGDDNITVNRDSACVKLYSSDMTKGFVYSFGGVSQSHVTNDIQFVSASVTGSPPMTGVFSKWCGVDGNGNFATNADSAWKFYARNPEADVYGAINGMAFDGATRTIMVGPRNFYNLGLALSSTDGGHTWGSIPGLLGSGVGWATWNTIYYDGTRFMVGGQSNETITGYVYTSTDGTTWAASVLANFQPQHFITAGSYKLARGRFWNSSGWTWQTRESADNGLTWYSTNVESQTGLVPTDMIYSGSTLAVFGTDGGSPKIASGTHPGPGWSLSTSSFDAAVQKSYMSGNIVFAFGTSGSCNVVLSSSDLRNWSKSIAVEFTGSTIPSFVNAAYNGQTHVGILSDRSTVQSSDGVNWSRTNLGILETAVVSSGSSLVAAGWMYTTAIINTSVAALSSLRSPVRIKYAAAANDAKRRVIYVTGGSSPPPAAAGYLEVSGTSVRTIYGYRYNDSGIISSDPFVAGALPIALSRHRIEIYGDLMYALGGETITMVSGVLKHAGNSNVYMGRLNTDNTVGEWIVVSSLPGSRSGSSGAGSIAGTTMVLTSSRYYKPISDDFMITSVASSGNVMVAAGVDATNYAGMQYQGQPKVAVSLDRGEVWHTSSLASGFAYVDGVVTGISGSTVVVTWKSGSAITTDGVNWTVGTITSDPVTTPSWFVVSGSTMVVGGSGYSRTSADGLHWTGTVGNATGIYDYAAIVSGSKIIAIGEDVGNSGAWASSSDGLTWGSGAIGPFGSDFFVGQGIIFSGSRAIVLGTYSDVNRIPKYAVSDDGLQTWVTGNIFSDPSILTARWSMFRLPLVRDYGNVFVGVGAIMYVSGTTVAPVVTSQNGTQWSASFMPTDYGLYQDPLFPPYWIMTPATVVNNRLYVMNSMYYDHGTGNTGDRHRYCGVFNTAMDPSVWDQHNVDVVTVLGGYGAQISGTSSYDNIVTNGTQSYASKIEYAGAGIKYLSASRASDPTWMGPANVELQTYGAQLGAPDIRPVYPILDDVYEYLVESDIDPSASHITPGRKLIGFRPGLKNSEIFGDWEIQIAVDSDLTSELNVNNIPLGYNAKPEAAVWVRQARIEFLVEKGSPASGIRYMNPARRQLYRKPSFGSRDGRNLVDIVSGSNCWDSGVHYIYTGNEDMYGRRVGITTDMDDSQLAVSIRLTGSLAQHLTGTPDWFLNPPPGEGMPGLPYIPISSASFGEASNTSPMTGSNTDMMRATVDQRLPVPVDDTLRAYLTRNRFIRTTQELYADELARQAASGSYP